MYPETLQQHERSGWRVTLEAFQGRYRVYLSVHNGMKWPSSMTEQTGENLEQTCCPFRTTLKESL